ncbi:hypothetical protein [Saccharopolyspora sp. ASAGF58]|uniref:CdiA C-terminal domain-containing protein n=1 Tax=Saccharopolyspora sp. ASAGF58 TaxID=2719023 RepID=UPI00143FEEED|nr:hypothetical protein [Saccharopolyspora sp. ASAGF58]QIZ35326.1 hypothetical protein FDZ84_12180 [Saccharopolyspora sp. ASAGF58]
MNDQTISGQAENLRLTADAVPLNEANALCDTIEALRDQLAGILGTNDELVSEAHRIAETAADIVRTLANLRTTIQDTSSHHHGNTGGHRPANTSNPTASTQTEKPYDRLPKPSISKPQPLPAGVTGDPATWPGRIEDNGTTDETRFSSDERSVAERLAQTGPNIVRRVPHGKDDRTADATVNGSLVEFKTLQQKDGQIPTRKTVKKMIRKSQNKGGQSPDVIIDGRKTGLTPEEALNGLKAYLNAPENADKLSRVRVWGKVFDFDWKREG